MARSLGIDVGDRKTGVALSDPLGITCRPLTTIVETDRQALGREIVRLAGEHEVTEIVVGVPRPLQGGSSVQSQKSREVAAMLSRMASVPVTTWDERFTTKLAKGVRTAGGDDAVAAAFMLQNYLDSKAGEI